MNILTFFIVTTTTMMSPILVVCTTTTLPPAGVGVVGKCSLHINYYLGRETHTTHVSMFSSMKAHSSYIPILHPLIHTHTLTFFVNYYKKMTR